MGLAMLTLMVLAVAVFTLLKTRAPSEEGVEQPA